MTISLTFLFFISYFFKLSKRLAAGTAHNYYCYYSYSLSCAGDLHTILFLQLSYATNIIIEAVLAHDLSESYVTWFLTNTSCSQDE